MNVQVEYMDGVVRTHGDLSEDTSVQSGALFIRKSPHYGAASKLVVVVPLNEQIREVRFS